MRRTYSALYLGVWLFTTVAQTYPAYRGLTCLRRDAAPIANADELFLIYYIIHAAT